MMKLAACAAVVAMPWLAHAEASLVEHSGEIRERPSQYVTEVACDMSVDVRGAVAVVEVRQRFLNGGPIPLGAIHRYELPRGGAVTGFAVTTAGKRVAAVPVEADPPTTTVEDPEVLGADPALLEWDDGQLILTLQPIPVGREWTTTTTYATTVDVRPSGLRLELPDRGAMGACRGSIRATPGPGATVAAIRVDGHVADRFSLGARDVTIDVALLVRSTRPVVWTQSQRLPDGRSATQLTVLTPTQPTTWPRRVVLAIDGSRSMELVGRPVVDRVIRSVASALPSATPIEAIAFDRVATRIGAFTPSTISALEAALAKRTARNGSGLDSALRLAHATIVADKTPTLLVIVTDGVLGPRTDQLSAALNASPGSVDVLALVLEPRGSTTSNASSLRRLVSTYGGSVVELAADELDARLAAARDWLSPSWVDLAIEGFDIPFTAQAGGGFTRREIHASSPANLALTIGGRDSIRARTGPVAPVAALALHGTTSALFTTMADPDDAHVAAAQRLHARAIAAYPSVTEGISFAVPSPHGRIARSRRDMLAGGGTYERVVELEDPPREPRIHVGVATAPAPSAVVRESLERLFVQQLRPQARACYQRALTRDPKLAGTVVFELTLGRGEIGDVQLSGLQSPAFEACLLDAAYALSLSFPDLSINADDRTTARYPVTFLLDSTERPTVVLGDADSSEPIDIDAMDRGRKRIKVDATTPLGGMRPSPSER